MADRKPRRDSARDARFLLSATGAVAHACKLSLSDTGQRGLARAALGLLAQAVPSAHAGKAWLHMAQEASEAQAGSTLPGLQCVCGLQPASESRELSAVPESPSPP